MRNNLLLCAEGEKIACEYLKSRGYRILERNFRCPGGEIDVIALKKDVIVFVEVKSRRGLSRGSAKEAVNRVKMRRIVQCAMRYLKDTDMRGLKTSFGVFSFLAEGPHAGVEFIPNAFCLDDISQTYALKWS